MLVVFDEVLELGRLSGGPTVDGGEMKLATVVLLSVMVAAPACGGGGGSATDPGGSPTPLSASFVPDAHSSGPKTAAMAEGSTSNDVVIVNVTLTDTNAVFGTAFEVVFDPAQMVYLGYVSGTVFERGGDVPNYTVDGTTNPGRIVAGVARTSSSATDVFGTKTMIGLKFRVKQAGVFPLVIEHAVVEDGQAPPQEIPGISWFAGAVGGV